MEYCIPDLLRLEAPVEAIKLDNVRQLKKKCRNDIDKREFLQAFFE